MRRGTGQVIAMNGSGRANAASTPEALRAAGLDAMLPDSAHSVTIPGAVSAWAKLNAAHGKLGLDRLLQPAIAAAEDGFFVHARVAHDWGEATGRLRNNAASAQHYLKSGAAPAMGDRMRFPALAATLRTIRPRRRARLLRGRRRRRHGGRAARRRRPAHRGDFAEGLDGAEFVTPIQRRFKGLDVFQCPPNGTGIIALMMLGMLEGFGPAPGRPARRAAPASPHRGRPARLPRPRRLRGGPGAERGSCGEAALRPLPRRPRAQHPRHRRCELPPPGETLLPVHATPSTSAWWMRRAMRAPSSTRCSKLRLRHPRREFRRDAAQSRLRASACRKGIRTASRPNKRPMHTIIPGMAMKDGRPYMPFGVMGGHFQPMGQSLLLSNMLDHGLDVQAALDLPRLFPRDGKIQCERGIPAEIMSRLDAMGHDCVEWAKPHGGGQAIVIDRERGCLIGGSDPRKDGCALGY
jgi:gamma-glutamyltranspeptidase/glutathione hydrolase